MKKLILLILLGGYLMSCSKTKQLDFDAANLAATFVLMNDFCPDFEYKDFAADCTRVNNRFAFTRELNIKELQSLRLKADISFKSGENPNPEDIRQWEVNSLAVYDQDGRKVWEYDGRGEQLIFPKVVELTDSVTYKGIKFKIAEFKNNERYDNGSRNAIRLLTQDELPDDTVKELVKYLRYRYDVLQFGTYDKRRRGEEYAATAGDYFIRFKPGEFTPGVRIDEL